MTEVGRIREMTRLAKVAAEARKQADGERTEFENRYEHDYRQTLLDSAAVGQTDAYFTFNSVSQIREAQDGFEKMGFEVTRQYSACGYGCKECENFTLIVKW